MEVQNVVLFKTYCAYRDICDLNCGFGSLWSLLTVSIGGSKARKEVLVELKTYKWRLY
jgi:hypothetical protein